MVSLQMIAVSSFLGIHLKCSCHVVFCVPQECICLESGYSGPRLGTPWNESTVSVRVCVCVCTYVCVTFYSTTSQIVDTHTHTTYPL